MGDEKGKEKLQLCSALESGCLIEFSSRFKPRLYARENTQGCPLEMKIDKTSFLYSMLPKLLDEVYFGGCSNLSRYKSCPRNQALADALENYQVT